MRIALVSIALAGLLVLSGCAAPFSAGTVGASDTSSAFGTAQVATDDADVDAPRISVSATGRATADADLAVVRVSVVATADTADAARQQVADDSARMRQALRDAGVADDAVRTAHYAIYPQYDYTGSERELRGYRAVHAYVIEVAPDRAGEVVDVAVANGGSVVDGVTFTLSDEARADLRAAALTDAMSAARADAETIAAAEGLSVSGVHAASTSADYGVPVPLYADREAAGGGASTTFEPGPVTVTATVQVTYTAA